MKKIFELILAFLTKNTDKCLHFSIGYIIVSLIPFHIYALLFVVILGISKEIYDKYVPNHTSD